MIIVRRVCCWCKTTMGLVIDPTMTKDTHGGCAPCVQAWKQEYLYHKEAK